MTIEDGICHYCKKECRPLRCSRCRNVLYCSAECQKDDWKAGHRAECGRASRGISSPQAQEAWNELKQCLVSTSIEDAHKKYQIATAKKGRLEADENQSKSQSKGLYTPTRQPQTPLRFNQDEEGQKSSKTVHASEQAIVQSLEINGILSNSSKKWTFAIEEMPNISCYSVTLRPHQDAAHDCDDRICPNALELSIQPLTNGHTVVVLVEKKEEKKEVLFAVRFPTKLLPTTAKPDVVVQIEPDTICLRLQSETEMMSNPSQHPSTPVKDVNALRCRSCDRSLLDKQPVTKVLPLARGCWDEVLDYLICYNGAPAVDFSSAAATVTKGVALEDSGFIVLHREDLSNSVCVLALEGYGAEDEELGQNRNSQNFAETVDPTERSTQSITYRGSRSWRDSVGGATVCCALCCSKLGFASIESPDTFRLLKHRLSSGSEQSFQSYSSTSFVTREMMRYAESKAIFTFVIATKPDEQRTPRRYLLLRLLSWDTRLATSKSSIDCDNGVDVPKFLDIAKVIYEVSNENLEGDSDLSTHWRWGGSDLCCFPTSFSKRNMDSQPDDGYERQSAGTKKASVQLHLRQEEWTELHQSLQQGSTYFSKAVAEATILSKLGHTASTGGSVGLSALPLL